MFVTTPDHANAIAKKLKARPARLGHKLSDPRVRGARRCWPLISLLLS